MKAWKKRMGVDFSEKKRSDNIYLYAVEKKDKLIVVLHDIPAPS